MPYSEVGEVTPTIAKSEWNAQFEELYDLVAEAEADGPYIKRIGTDVVNASSTVVDTGLAFPVVSGVGYRFRGHLIWHAPNGVIAPIRLKFTGPPNDGSSVYGIWGAGSAGSHNQTVQGIAEFGGDMAYTFGAVDNGPVPTVSYLSGFFKAAADGTAKLQFGALISTAITVKVGSTLEVYRVE